MKSNINMLVTSTLMTVATACFANPSNAQIIDNSCINTDEIDFIVLTEERPTNCIQEAVDTIYNPNSGWQPYP